MIFIIIYNLLLIFCSILFLPLILMALILKPKFRAGFLNKIGFYSYKQNDKPTVIFHSVSVGETNAIKELAKRYHTLHKDENIVITTTTKTGQEIAKIAFKDIAEQVTYFPFDFCFSVISFLNVFNPSKIIVAETEIWPCFIFLSKMKKIKIYTVNGRISPHSYNGYKKIKLFIAPILNKYEKLFMQSQSDAQRLIDIGARNEKVEVMGNLKFDVSTNLTEENILKYKEELKTEGYRIFIAASTHTGEDEIVIRAYKKLKEKHTDAKLMIAPRHPERFEEIYKLMEHEGLKCDKRSNKADFNSSDVILLDTMGELAKLFSITYIAFIGGSFTQTGGHNPLEACIWGKPVISGPIVFNFKDVYKIASEKKCAVIVNTKEELEVEVMSFYDNALKYKTFSANAKIIFEENKGAINFVLERI